MRWKLKENNCVHCFKFKECLDRQNMVGISTMDGKHLNYIPRDGYYCCLWDMREAFITRKKHDSKQNY